MTDFFHRWSNQFDGAAMALDLHGQWGYQARILLVAHWRDHAGPL